MNTTVHIVYRTIKIRPFNVKLSKFIDFGIENNEKNSKFEVGDQVRISKYTNIFAKGCTLAWSDKWKTNCWNFLGKIIVKDKSNRV